MSNEAESSLPKELVYTVRSSPPILTQYSSFEMDDNVTSKSEPATTPDAHQTPKRPRHKRMKSDDTERPASAQQDRGDSDDHSDVDADQIIAEDEDLDPAAPITHFDWDRLHQQYHDAMNECNSEEVELMQQWASLMEVLLYLTHLPAKCTADHVYSTSASGLKRAMSMRRTEHINGTCFRRCL